MFCMDIWCSFNDYFYLQPCRRQILCHFARLEEDEIEGYRLVPPFVKMDNLLANVERKQERPAEAQHTLELA